MSWSGSTPRNGDQAGPLTEMLKDAKIECPRESNFYFIPVDAIRKLEEKRPVREELRRIFPRMDRDPLDHYVHLICTKATRIFAILLASSMDIQEGICDLLDEGITDVNLPFVRVPLYGVERGGRSSSSSFTLAKYEHTNCQREGHAGCGIRALSNWGRFQIETLSRDQWLALAPVFRRASKGIPHYHFEDNTVFPFTEDDENNNEKLKSGGYSEVWPVRIHPAHQDIIRSSDPSVSSNLNERV